jgi:hypothetical protein
MEWRSVKKNLPPKNVGGERNAEEGKSKGDSSKNEAADTKVVAVADVERSSAERAESKTTTI